MKGETIKQRSEKIGYVMQNPNHMISKTLLYDEIALGLRLRGWGEAEIREKVEETLRICGLYSLRSWPISALSYGTEEKGGHCLILVLDPEVIILTSLRRGRISVTTRK